MTIGTNGNDVFTGAPDSDGATVLGADDTLSRAAGNDTLMTFKTCDTVIDGSARS